NDWNPDVAASYRGVTFEAEIYYDEAVGREPANLVGEVRVAEVEDPDDWYSWTNQSPQDWLLMYELNDELVARLLEAYEAEGEVDPW
ncbi:MAG: hypothetical protein ACO3O1_11190, partial [Ilumatobacteraceae bacterium]